jgi:hypothetical protein
MIQVIMIAAIILVAYSAFHVVTITAIASLPPDMTGLGVPLGIAAAIVVLLGGLLL